MNRNRIWYFLLLCLLVVTGILSRKITYLLPQIVNVYLGDALWAAMIYVLCAFVFKHAKIISVFTISISFCIFIELSQLYHAVWIDQLRSTTLGGLILGFGFLWTDLVAYVLGTGIAMGIETLKYRKYEHSHNE